MTEHEQQAAELQERSERLGEQISETRKDWERKRADDGVPGAVPADEPAGGEDDPARQPWPDE